MTLPIKSRHGLTRCGVCRAHIQAGERPSETDCPFCGANLLRGGPAITRPTGRGGVLAASLLAFGLTACGADEPPAQLDPAPIGAEEPTAGDPADPAEPTGTDGFAPDQAPEPNAVAEYGARPEPVDPPPPPQPTVNPSGDTEDQNVLLPAYGAPPPDDQFDDTPADPMPPLARYGAAPMPDRFTPRPADPPPASARYGLPPMRRDRGGDALEGVEGI